jgi:hypothetical protein
MHGRWCLCCCVYRLFFFFFFFLSNRLISVDSRCSVPPRRSKGEEPTKGKQKGRVKPDEAKGERGRRSRWGQYIRKYGPVVEFLGSLVYPRCVIWSVDGRGSE